MTTALVPPAAFAAPLQPNDDNTTTPIKHVIVIYGENRSFDHLYATYQPKAGETVNNLLSEGIINVDGTPGENSDQATQFRATDPDTFQIAPTKNGPFATLPPLTAGGPKNNSDTSPPFNTFAQAQNATSALYQKDLKLLLTGATGLSSGALDTRLPNVSNLPNIPVLPDAGYFLQCVCSQSGASVLPDVPADGLRSQPCECDQSKRLLE